MARPPWAALCHADHHRGFSYEPQVVCSSRTLLASDGLVAQPTSRPPSPAHRISSRNLSIELSSCLVPIRPADESGVGGGVGRLACLPPRQRRPLTDECQHKSNDAVTHRSASSALCNMDDIINTALGLWADWSCILGMLVSPTPAHMTAKMPLLLCFFVIATFPVVLASRSPSSASGTTSLLASKYH
ncbi:hypothetical protein B0T16DRAFT_161852 [Cercophora newfieldiana]|uniref:Uncharacterized protein n=1 Tax=Cercophora newfieldiana TaxID=92897 RepID=A0AA40CRG0_9PEZI|nr:hypothetical protein B0T16DRAFT_161852 [Cercophora newfieldiana]